jgi:hypothetical protein
VLTLKQLKISLPILYEKNIIDSDLFRASDVIRVIDELVEIAESVGNFELLKDNVVYLSDFRRPTSS